MAAAAAVTYSSAQCVGLGLVAIAASEAEQRSQPACWWSRGVWWGWNMCNLCLAVNVSLPRQNVRTQGLSFLILCCVRCHVDMLPTRYICCYPCCLLSITGPHRHRQVLPTSFFTSRSSFWTTRSNSSSSKAAWVCQQPPCLRPWPDLQDCVLSLGHAAGHWGTS